MNLIHAFGLLCLGLAFLENLPRWGGQHKWCHKYQWIFSTSLPLNTPNEKALRKVKKGFSRKFVPQSNAMMPWIPLETWCYNHHICINLKTWNRLWKNFSSKLSDNYNWKSLESQLNIFLKFLNPNFWF